MDAVLLDVGGVLLLPTSEVMLPPLAAAGAHPTEETLRRAHYRATAVRDAHPGAGWELYRRTYAQTCGVAPEYVGRVADEIGRVLDGRTWMRVAPGAVDALRTVAEAGTPMGIVSNSVGVIAEMLAEAEVCQVGPGPCVEVAVVVDSALIGIEKPAPEIFDAALEKLDVLPRRTVYVGDTARADVDGARAAGIRPLHLDPYGDCPDPAGDHEHIDGLDRLATMLG